jgi:hypothetical protein
MTAPAASPAGAVSAPAASPTGAASAPAPSPSTVVSAASPSPAPVAAAPAGRASGLAGDGNRYPGPYFRGKADAPVRLDEWGDFQ